MKILNDKHLTALDRRALQTMRDNGWTSAVSKRRNYQLRPAADGAPQRFEFRVERHEQDDYGRPVSRVSMALLQF